MSIMFEVYYRTPIDEQRETRILREVTRHGGGLTYEEKPQCPETSAICLTYEFNDRKSAEDAARVLRELGEHVEGPGDY